MKLITTIGTLGVLAASLITAQIAQAAPSEDVFINPDWANSAWYLGAGVGQGRATIDEGRLTRSLTANGATLSSFSKDERTTGYKLFVGRQLNQYFALELGYFDLGTYGFRSTTSGGGILNGEASFRGANLDLIAQLPLTERISLLGSVGMNYAKSSTHFTGNRLFAVTDPNPGERKLNGKAGLGIEFKLSEALALRGEIERYRINDAVRNRGDSDLYSVSLVYKLGRPAPVMKQAPQSEPMPEPVAVAAPVATSPAPPPPPPAPVAASEKVSFSAAALFDFDRYQVKLEGKTALDSLVDKFVGMNVEVIVTVGHTDSMGSNAYNEKLSLRRAEAVKAYLVSKGVEASRVYVEGKGETQPVADNKNAAGRAMNRRVTVELVGTRTVMPQK